MKLPNSTGESGTRTKDEVVDLMTKSYYNTRASHRKFELSWVTVRCSGLLRQRYNTQCTPPALKDLGLENYLDDSGQKHHVNRILRTLKLFFEDSACWT